MSDGRLMCMLDLVNDLGDNGRNEGPALVFGLTEPSRMRDIAFWWTDGLSAYIRGADGLQQAIRVQLFPIDRNKMMGRLACEDGLVMRLSMERSGHVGDMHRDASRFFGKWSCPDGDLILSLKKMRDDHVVTDSDSLPDAFRGSKHATSASNSTRPNYGLATGPFRRWRANANGISLLAPDRRERELTLHEYGPRMALVDAYSGLVLKAVEGPDGRVPLASFPPCGCNSAA
jgi:hypothetical protein